MLMLLSTIAINPVSAESQIEDMVLATEVNPKNGHTYHLLKSSSWTEAASMARSLDGFLVTVDDVEENTWILETFGVQDEKAIHMWIGLSDADDEGDFRWHDGSPFFYRNWGEGQPSTGEDDDYVLLAGTNMNTINAGEWNDATVSPEYFPVYGVVEVGEGADYALRFDGHDDYIVAEHSDENGFAIEDELTLSAWIHSWNDEGIQFIMMQGDYGFGLYLDDGALGFSSEYSLSKHPKSESTVPSDEWVQVIVTLEEGVGGAFYINGQYAGNISSTDANIPDGDFGSNTCYEDNLDCDEFYIGRMGAGSDSNYFEGLIDDVMIWNRTFNATEIAEGVEEFESISSWTFPEGEGGFTEDGDSLIEGEIKGAAWVMPDGTIIAQAIELINGDSITIDALEGEIVLFYAEIPERTTFVSLSAWSEFKGEGDFEEENIYDLYIGHDEIPDEWNNKEEVETYYGFSFQSWNYPEEGTYWLAMYVNEDIESFTIELSWNVAPPPPSLDEMTELNDGIPVPDLDAGSRDRDWDEVHQIYFYVDLQENLSELKVSTKGGKGNADLMIAYDMVPDVTGGVGSGGNIIIDPWFGGESEESVSNRYDSSSGQGNDETVRIVDAEPGIYYIVVYTWGQFRDVSIVADFTYPPENIDADSAIELTPGIEYGPLAGWDGLHQYFFVEVEQDVERLIVDLSDGDGQATLYMRLEQAPSETEWDHSSDAPGAGDRIAFNDPTPGKWYILLTTDELFSGVNIKASFADRYVWDYDGTPLELFNGEELSDLSGPSDEKLLFFTKIEGQAMSLKVETWGGDGDLLIHLEGEMAAFDDDWKGEESPRGRQGEDWGNEVTSWGSGTLQNAEFFFPAEGQFDITVEIISEIADVSIMASWEIFDLPDEPDKPDVPGTEDEFVNCREIAKDLFRENDADGNGIITKDEIRDDMPVEFENYLEDGAIDEIEAIQVTCSCANELEMAYWQVAEGNDEVSNDQLNKLDLLNDFDFKSIDRNQDGMIDDSEMERETLACKTTYDAWDRDGDGTPDEDDAFPDNPKEDKDTDGDGVGDNADLAPSLDNKMLYIAAAIAGLLLLGFLAMVMFNGRPEQEMNSWQEEAVSNPMAAGLFSEQSGFDTKQVPEVPAMPDIQSPPNDLIGLIQTDGSETIEWPEGSGDNWVRRAVDQPWSKN